jgi:hypothetical protein
MWNRIPIERCRLVTADPRVIHLGQFGQGLVTAVMKRPAPDISADARQRLGLTAGWKPFMHLGGGSDQRDGYSSVRFDSWGQLARSLAAIYPSHSVRDVVSDR